MAHFFWVYIKEAMLVFTGVGIIAIIVGLGAAAILRCWDEWRAQ